MGDVTLTTHFVRNVRNRFPDAKIDFLVSKDYRQILEHNPRLDKVISYDKSWNREELRNSKYEILESNHGPYDFIADLQNNGRTAFFLDGLGKYISPVRKLRLHKLSEVYFKKALVRDFNIPEIYLETVKDLGVTDDGLGLEFWLKSDDKSADYELLRSGKNFMGKIAIAPGAHFYTKRWLKEHFVEFINMLQSYGDFEIALMGGQEDMETCRYIENKTGAGVINLAGKLSISGTAYELSRQDILVTNDTGVMHIAAAMRIPIIAIFGSSVREFGFSPFRTPNLIAERDLSCRPCSHIGKNSCPKKHFKCMSEILPSEVFKLFTKFTMDLGLDFIKT